MNEIDPDIYSNALANITEIEFNELWSKCYPNDIIHLPYYWNEFSQKNLINRHIYMINHKKLEKAFENKILKMYKK